MAAEAVGCADVMVVDDSPVNLELLRDILAVQGHQVRAYSGGRAAWAAAQEQAPDLLLLDINMPEMDGYEVCAAFKGDPLLADVPILFISALHDVADKLRAFEAGGADYITKPFQFAELRARIETHLRARQQQLIVSNYSQNLEELVTAQVEELMSSQRALSDAQQATICALSSLAECRDDDTGTHIERVTEFARALARRLAEYPRDRELLHPDYIEALAQAAPLHDIGKVGIPDAILQKPGSLTAEEFAAMQRHTLLGAQTLERVQLRYADNTFIGIGIEIARSHHEKWDGSGYPDGLSGEAIPLSARILALADVYDALRSARCYKPAFSHEKSCEIISEGVGRHFDPLVARAFFEIHEEIAEIRARLE